MQYKKISKDKTKRRSKTQLTRGASSNGQNKSIVNYHQNLRVLPKLKRTKENCNSHGVQND